MPYALIPDGYSLKKVTKAQKSALDEHNRSKAIERFAGTAGSPIFLLVVIAAGLFYLASQFKLPGIDIRDAFQAAFPQLSAVLGIKGELSQEAFDKITTLINEGAIAYDPNASVLAQTLFPTPEKRAEKKEMKEQLKELGL
jgi:hypothetical protein